MYFIKKNPTIINHCNDVLTATCASADDVKTLNSRLIDVITKVAGTSLELKKRPDPKKRRGRKTAKNKWFDLDCIKSRIDLRKTSKKYCKAPLDEETRKVYYSKRNEHKRLIKQKKAAFYYKLNIEIEDNNNIKRESLKKLFQRPLLEENHGPW